MAGGVFSQAQLFGMTIRESATDGSDFTNPAADYRRLFLGEDGILHLKDSAGTVTDIGGAGSSVATDAIWDAAGDLVQGTGANTGARLALGAAGTVVRSTGTTNAYAFPPGYEYDFAEVTTSVNIDGTTEAGATTILTGNAVTYDGSTIVLIHAYFPMVTWSLSDNTRFWLYDGSSSIGEIARLTTFSGTTFQSSVVLERRLTPSAAAHTYGIRASSGNGNGSVDSGAGGAGNVMPGFVRITKV